MSTSTKPSEVSMPFNKRFMDEVGYFRGNAIEAGKLKVSNANLYLVALTILAECECLEVSGKARERELLKGYEKVVAKLEVDGTIKTYPVSIRKIANEVVALHDFYKEHEFLECTMMKNWKWMNDSKEEGFDPYRLSKGESEVRLCDAGITLLVKSLRMYLMETVKRFFQGVRDQEEWGLSHVATYRSGKITRSSNDFTLFVDSMMNLYDYMCCLSPTLDEIKKVSSDAFLAGKQEFSDKKTTPKQTTALKQTDDKKPSNESTTDESTEKKVTVYFESTGKSKTQPVTVKKSNVNLWKNGNPLVKKEEKEVVEEKKVTESKTEAVDSDSDNGHPSDAYKEMPSDTQRNRYSEPAKSSKTNSQQKTTRRVVRSGKPSKKNNDDAGWTTVKVRKH